MKAHHRCLRALYDMRDGIPLFRAAMSEERFEQLKHCLRFDDPLRRQKEDKIAPVRHLIEQYNDRILELYVPGAYLTIDEMLIEFHGRVGMKQYIPSKPGKFGLKVFWVAESDTAMPLRAILYSGKGTLPGRVIEIFGGFVPCSACHVPC